MSPRPRTVSDAAILAATAAVIGRLGPARFTLADVGAEVGLSAATLVQRFGSKRALMLALSAGSAASIDDGFAHLRATHASPLAALIAGASHMAAMARSPEELANHLAFLQIDLSDPEFHALALEHAVALRRGYRGLVEAASQSGELIPCDAARLARLVEATAGGSLIGWAIHREGDASAYVRADVEALLAPYRAGTSERT